MAENDKFVAPVDVQEQLQKTAKIYRNKLITMPTRLPQFRDGQGDGLWFPG